MSIKNTLLHKNLMCVIMFMGEIMITDNDILTILNMLTSAGYKAYAVGGYVRNSLMGIECTDCDITTSAAPNEIIEVFSNHKVIKTGIKHGTVTVVYNNIPYEITTFRTESGYTDFRHPNKVEFVNDVYLDLSRRDFTVNAIAYNPTQGVVDPFNGIDDIKNNILRTVGDPKERFNEDALRILRALRFASVLGFTIHNNTAAAINEMANTVANISAERIYTELKKLILGKHAVNVIMQFKTAINKIIPIEKIPENFDLLPLDISMRFAALCGSSVLQALNRLKADNNTKEKCALLLSSKPIPNDIIAIKQYISALGRENAAYVAKYRRIIFGEDKDCKIDDVLSKKYCLSISELAINGADLINLGIESKNIGKTLNKLLQLVIKEKVSNEREALLFQAQNIK